MRPTSIPMRFFTLSLLACGLAQAQTPASRPAASSPTTASESTQRRPEQRIQHIRIEDSDARIDEVRVGSETKSITVQPKGGMPAYQVAPVSGERSWKILGF
ncbi:hypothetical protein [Rhodoferax sp.]|uniref:hypothetical protein n=1 Tax=Rhodoferax sp. TaxID=50421 RepID=UPI002602EF3B|nr:hypothetical protein [Rhodoferax sp.]